jgi:hypothetical protein
LFAAVWEPDAEKALMDVLRGTVVSGMRAVNFAAFSDKDKGATVPLPHDPCPMAAEGPETERVDDLLPAAAAPRLASATSPPGAAMTHSDFSHFLMTPRCTAGSCRER